MCLKIGQMKGNLDYFSRIKFKNRFILAFIEKFLFADKESEYNAFYYYSLNNEDFKLLIKENAEYFNFKIEEKAFNDNSDDLNVSLNIKKGEETPSLFTSL